MPLRYISGGSSLHLDAGRCVGCGRCLEVCPHGVFAMANGKASAVARERCMECGACARNCVAAAITVQPGVGCAYALLKGMVAGGSASCGCGSQGRAGS